jgi:uncharacterized protein (TIGR00299 family) protein
MKIAYFDCFAGAGGDMIVAAMLDAGLSADFLKAQLETLGLGQPDIKITETSRAGLKALSFACDVPKQLHHHRNLEQITEIIANSGINTRAKKTAAAIFEKLARAEASVHGKAVADIQFHELGAVDSIVDIVSASVGIEALAVEKVYCSALSVGGGTVRCAHGILPVPSPATAELLKAVPITAGPIQAELLTPTAAAILTTIVDQFGPLPTMKIEMTGYGAGSLESEQFPNVLRLFLGQTVSEDSTEVDSVCLLETNIDDISAEIVGSVTEQLLENGALDVFTTPIYMKQNRPAVRISVLCKNQDTERLQRYLFEQGLTFGIRKQLVQRSKLAREFVTVATDFGRIRIKTGLLDGRVVNVKPEFADCASAAKKHNVPLKTVLDAALAAYKNI